MAVNSGLKERQVLPHLDFNPKKVFYQLPWTNLIDHALDNDQGRLTTKGALNVKTGKFTGRSPKDRFIVKDSLTENKVWWDGEINKPFAPDSFEILLKEVRSYLNNKEVYVRDGFACALEKYKVKVRVINETPWANMFFYNMFLRPNNEELDRFGTPDWIIYQVPSFMAIPNEHGTLASNFSILNFKDRIALIGGSGYTGEMKKGIFSALNFELPVLHDVLTMHCSANVGKDKDTALFFGLSGTGKTTLSADHNRKLIGDDEHGWTADSNQVFNFEGGCYAKVIDLSKEKEPEIYAAIKPGALLENCVFETNTNDIDYSDTTITQNTRVSYPIHHIKNTVTPSVASNPKNIFFLTFDAFGVLPAISKLSAQQAAYHFISGYTSKVAGTELGVNEPQTTFSACFGAPFMPLHPKKYAEMLMNRIHANSVNVWLVNTGLNGQGKRMPLAFTRAAINKALSGKLEQNTFKKESFFGLEFPQRIQADSEIELAPELSWDSTPAYEQKAQELVDKFKANFKKFETDNDKDLLSGGPL